MKVSRKMADMTGMTYFVNRFYVMIRFRVLVLCIAWITLDANAQNDPTEQRLKRPLVGLPITKANAVGINPDSIQHLISLIRTTPPSDFRGLVVLKDGKLVVE